MRRVQIRKGAVLLVCVSIAFVVFLVSRLESWTSPAGVPTKTSSLPIHPRADPQATRPTTPLVVKAKKPPTTAATPPSVWRDPTLPENLHDADQANSDLIQNVRAEWILKPSTAGRKLREPNRDHYSQRGQSQFIDDLLKHRTRGFYIEAGAGDGEYLSNSLFFEKSRQWSGLLVEANAQYFSDIVKLQREAYVVHACLSPEPRPMMLEFQAVHVLGGLVGYMEDGHKRRVQREAPNFPTTHVQCLPLYTILRALNVSHVDYWSLDIEGAELDVLRTFPFDEIPVDTISVEYAVSGDSQATQVKLSKLKELLIDKYGYQQAPYKHMTEDIIFSKGV